MDGFTPIDEIPAMRAALRDTFASGRMKPIAYRKEQLARLAYMVKEHLEEFHEAMKSDLGRGALESDFMDIQPTMRETMEAYEGVEKWAKPEKPAFDFSWFAMSPEIRKEPKGVALVISPFNFPMVLLLGPLAGALAAGCTVMLKPSEQTPAVAALIAKLVPQYLDPDVVKVVLGAIPETTKLLEMQWDQIMYAGNGRVAKIVLTAAAKHLTPVTTELGGKNPVIIDPKSDLKLAARRIAWGKFANCGQICAAPDYVLITPDVQDEFIKELSAVHATFYPDGPRTSSSYSRIVSKAHTLRLQQLIANTKGTIVLGGETDVEDRYIAPTVVANVGWDDALMEDEIFGPILPIVTVQSVDEAIAKVNQRDHPLSLYVFSQDATFRAKVFDNTQSGAAIANETVIHYAAHDMPFGGIGPSGTGASTGKYNFDMFTHNRASLNGKGWIDTILLKNRYPPYTAAKAKALSMATEKKLPPKPKGLLPAGAKADGSKFLTSLRLAWWLLPVVLGYWIVRRSTLKA